jgi:lipopolysaccharide transport system ATP-binding protein
MEPAIKVENLSKHYRIGTNKGSYRTLRESVTEAAAASWRGVTRLADRAPRIGGSANGNGSTSNFWALKDVSFEVEPGEVVGIIGRNGAGKSTLLKILSRITEPTSGRAEFRGRIGSLLEVGTGFHPELTGRENIYLNGSILGMSRREIECQFDDIAEFAEIDRFLETPVKRYSSGMYVKLAFAVAAYLEPEILLVDEVLAVGDARFQKKCLGKMDDIAKGGRTVLFVSHQMSAVQRLCKKVLFLERGCLKSFGPTDKIISHYLSEDTARHQPDQWIDLTGAPRSGTGEARFTAMRFCSPDLRLGGQPYSDGPVDIEVCIESHISRRASSLAVTFYDRYGTKMVNADTVALDEQIQLAKGISRHRLRIDELHLTPNTYIVGLWLADGNSAYDDIREAGNIEVANPPTDSLGRRPAFDGAVTCSFHVTPGVCD